MVSPLVRVAAASAVIALLLAACSAPDPEPSVTPSATETPTSAPPSETAEPHEIVTGVDVAVLERLVSPTTGEVWHEPIPISNRSLLDYADYGILDDYSYFEIGTRGDAIIVAALPAYFDYYTEGFTVYAVFEIDVAGARNITCPSARAGDVCLDWSSDWEEADRTLDPTVHYDSLTYPERVSPLPGWELSVSRLAGAGFASSHMAYGDGNEWPGIATTPDERAFLGRDSRIDVLELGESTLVEFRAPGDVPGLTDSRFAIETPYGGIIASQSSFTGAYYGQGAVEWNDGVDTFTHTSLWGEGDIAFPVTSASLTCFGPDETIADTLDPSKWEVAGTHRLGFDVYLPVEGGNPIAQAVFETERDNSWGDDIDGIDLSYPYATYEEFLAARSVFAWERPDGEWIIAIDGFARQRVYECA